MLFIYFFWAYAIYNWNIYQYVEWETRIVERNTFTFLQKSKIEILFSYDLWLAQHFLFLPTFDASQSYE